MAVTVKESYETCMFLKFVHLQLAGFKIDPKLNVLHNFKNCDLDRSNQSHDMIDSFNTLFEVTNSRRLIHQHFKTIGNIIFADGINWEKIVTFMWLGVYLVGKSNHHYRERVAIMFGRTVTMFIYEWMSVNSPQKQTPIFYI